MFARIWAPALGTLLLLSACKPHQSLPDGSVVLDETIALTRGDKTDSAQRDITVADDSYVVAFADEQLVDVKLKLAAGKSTVEVENNLRGAGIEIATLKVPAGARVTVALAGPQDSISPGSIRLRVKVYDVDAAADPKFSAQLAGYQAWSAATKASFRADSAKKTGTAEIAKAITSLEPADRALAAKARVVRASMLQYFGIDSFESLAEAQRAEKAFASLAQPDAFNEARASFIEATALRDIAEESGSPIQSPTPAEANKKCREILVKLAAVDSPFGALERARALDELGGIDVYDALLDEADGHFRAAKEMFHSVGYTAGEIEMRASLAKVLNQRGAYADSADAYDEVLPVIDKIVNPYRRVTAVLSAATSQQFAGRADEAAINLLKVIDIAHEYGMSAQEGGASQVLGYLYWYRGDYFQAKTFFTRAYEIARADDDAIGQSATLQSSGMVARFDGDYAKALEMHREAARLASNPIFRMRSQRLVALDYASMENYPEAISQMRAALATKLQDPRHHAFTDLKIELAELLIDHGDGSSATLDESAKLLVEALKKSEEMHDVLREVFTHRVMASLLTHEQKPRAALAEYKQTFELIFKYRNSSANAEFRTTSLTQEQPAFRGYFDLVMKDVVARGPARFRPALPGEESALRLLEQARESHLGAPRTVPMDAATTARVDALLAQMADQSLKIARLLKPQLTKEESTQLQELQLAMSRARAEVDRERTAAAEKSAGGKPAASAARSWRTIASGAARLSYALGNDHAYVWARSAAGLIVATLAEDPQTIERELTELAGLDRQRDPAKVELLLAHLSSVLLPAGLLPANSTGVEIVAEGRIASVPFAALHSPTDPKWLLAQTHSISMISTMFAVDTPPRPKQARPFRLVALASGNGALRSAVQVDPAPRLQAATKEIRAVGELFTAREPAAKIKLLTGSEGSAQALSGMWSSGVDVVHFATHALADLRQPLASLLVLPAKDAAGTPTYLTAGQVQDWHGDADLVFLSACDSAIGPPRFAAGMPGLQRAFLGAGARGVIATLWPIEDVLAQQFSEDFYQRYTGGAAAVQALSETQRAWLAERPEDNQAQQIRRRMTALAHAYFAQ